MNSNPFARLRSPQLCSSPLTSFRADPSPSTPTVQDCRVLSGVMFNKDVVAPGRMRRRIEKPRILLLDSPLEYKKGKRPSSSAQRWKSYES